MHALEYVWNLGERFDAAALRRRVEERKGLFERLPGLVAKAFLLDESTRRFGGFYVFESPADADRFLASDLFAGSRASLGEPEIRRYELPAFVGPAADAVLLPPQHASLNHVMIYSADVPRSLAFYEGKLGFRVIEKMEGYARLEGPAGGTTIGIHRAEPGRELPGSSGIRLYFEIDELDALCRRLAEEGVPFRQPPMEMPWGWRHAYLDDPDGHEISIFRAGRKRLEPTPWPPSGS